MKIKYKLSEQEFYNINQSLYQEIANRASIYSFLFALLFSLYGLNTSQIILKFEPGVSIWSNTWPRFLFNGVPLVLLGYYLKNSRHSAHFKALLWAIVQPLILVIASFIYVWPLMYNGNLEIYKYFHAANVFVIIFGLTFVAPSRTVTLVHVASYVLLFLSPLLYLVRKDSELLLIVLSDFTGTVIGGCVAGHLTFQLRKKIALMDAHIKSSLKPLLGNMITSAVYNNNLELLDNKSTFGVILSMDLRGYTQFMHNNSKEITGPFMKEYHFLVSTTVGKFNGFIHKTTGDGHLISFGLMDQTENLSDILSIKNEVQDAENNKGKILTEMAIKVFEDLVEQYENLKIKYDVCDELNIGGALAAGHIETQIQGDETFRREVDIGGDTILRSARLEAYTKPLMEKIGIQCSMLILSPELIDNLKTNIDFDYWQVVDKDIAVRDFPAIKKVYYRIWKYKLGRPVRIAS